MIRLISMISGVTLMIFGILSSTYQLILRLPLSTLILPLDAARSSLPNNGTSLSTGIMHTTLTIMLHSSGGIFGRVADAMSAILTSMCLGPSKNWVDDFVFFRLRVLFIGLVLIFSGPAKTLGHDTVK